MAILIHLHSHLPRLVLIAWLLLSFAGAGAGEAHGQSQAPNLLELRKVIAFRDVRNAGEPARAVSAARAYLEEFPQGQYRDEVLLALGGALTETGETGEALSSFDQLIEEHPESPFREQALAESLPLLLAEGKAGDAFARLDTLLENYPRSVLKTQALLWMAGVQHSQEDHAGTLQTLDKIDLEGDLSEEQQASFYRLKTLALVKQGESAWQPLNRYLKRKDTAAHKAEVLTLVGEIARKASREDESLRYYRQVVEDFPVAEYLNEALFWRAELFNRTRMSQAPEEVRAARRETAIGYYSAYLKRGEQTHAAAAYLGRGGLLRNGKQLQPALADYERAVEMNPDLGKTTEVVGQRVELYLAMKRREEALALLDQARQDPSIPINDRTVFQVDQARLFYEDEQCDRVVALLNPMPIIHDPADRPKAFFMRGFCRYRQGQWEKATFDLEGLINDPNYQDVALPPLLDAYEKSGQASRLVNLGEELLRAGRLQPSEELFGRLAAGYEMLGEPALMISAYQRLEEFDPSAVRTPLVQFRLGKAQEKLGRHEDAIVHLRAALQLIGAPEGEAPPPYPEAVGMLHGIYLKLGRFDESQTLLAGVESLWKGEEAIARLKGWRRELSLAWGRSALEKGEAEEAARKLEQALANTGPEEREHRLVVVPLLVAAYLQGKTPEKAAESFQGELERQEDEEYRRELSAAMLATLGNEPDKTVPAGNSDALVSVYRKGFAGIPRERSKERYQAAQVLDRLYQKKNDFGARAALVTILLKDGLDESSKEELRLYQSRIYKEWGAALIAKGDDQGAKFQLERGLSLLAQEDWRQRYEIIALLGRIHLNKKEYTELVLMTEDILPQLEDENLAGQVRHFLGQVHLDWGREADEEGNLKSSRIRYYRALDYLPASDWQRRLTAANGLTVTLRKQGLPGEAASVLERELPGIQDRGFRQQYALYLGRLYLGEAKNIPKAVKWLQVADLGGNDPLSLEAGYLLAERFLTENPQGALSRLRQLVDRKIAGSKWEVPIHYRLAILYHRQKQLKKALEHYRRVAGISNKEVTSIYPRSISQSREQVRQIEEYLKSSGNRNISVPKVKPE